MLQNMRIGLRSSLAFGVIGLLMLVLGGLSLVQLKQLNTQITVIATERVPSLQRIDEINKAFLQVRLYSLVLIHTADEATRQSLANHSSRELIS